MEDWQKEVGVSEDMSVVFFAQQSIRRESFYVTFDYMLKLTSFMKRWLFATVSLAVAVIVSSCQTYYHKTLVFNEKFENGDYEGAREYLSSQKKLRNKSGKVLYDLNYATSSFWMDDTEKSIASFDTADRYQEDFSKNYAYEALALISNPTVRPYELEYFECVMLHYFQAINYLKDGNMEGALVECRRMNLVLEQQSDAFKKHDGKRYSRDAFGHLLMGVLYEMSGDNNNAFVAYRNAIEIYEEDYSGMYGTSVPDALKRGVVRTAYKTGLAGEGRNYEKRYGINYDATSSQGKGRVVAFLMDGMSPVKVEKSIEFVKAGGTGVVSFTSNDGSLQIPIFLDGCTQSERNSLKSLSFTRLALPQYVNRGSRCAGILTINGSKTKAETVEDIEQIAHQSLKDRIWREVGKMILRAAAKEAMYQAVSSKNDYAGLFVGIANAVTEKADTRCWMSLPAKIRIVDLELEPGTYELNYTSCTTESSKIEVKEGKTLVLYFRGF